MQDSQGICKTQNITEENQRLQKKTQFTVFIQNRNSLEKNIKLTFDLLFMFNLMSALIWHKINKMYMKTDLN